MFTHLMYGKSKNNMSIRFVLSNLIAKAVWTARSMSGANKKMIEALAARKKEQYLKKEEYLQQFKMNCHKFHFQSFHPIYACFQ